MSTILNGPSSRRAPSIDIEWIMPARRSASRDLGTNNCSNIDMTCVLESQNAFVDETAATTLSKIPDSRPHLLFSDLRKTTGSPNRDISNCPICGDDLKPHQRTLTHTSCGWSYHRRCLEAWMIQKSPSTCPMDRCMFQIVELPAWKLHLLTPTERKIYDAWPRCDCCQEHSPNPNFDAVETEDRNFGDLLSQLPQGTDAYDHLAALVVVHLLDCAFHNIITGFCGLEGLADLWQDLLQSSSNQDLNAGRRFWERYVEPGIHWGVDLEAIKVAVCRRLERLDSLDAELGNLWQIMGQERAEDWYDLRTQAVGQILAGLELVWG